MTGPTIDGDRLLARLDALGAVGGGAGGGVTRLAWSAEDRAAIALVSGWLHEAGCATRLDAAGSVVADVAGRVAGLGRLAVGSHLDTVVDAGRLDGAYGVVAGVEVVAALAAVGVRLRHPLRVAAFANEEGVVAPPFTGSLVAAGRAALIDRSAAGPDGRTLADRLVAAGGDPDHLESARWRGELAAYIELHVEQGPVLADDGMSVGVVTAVTGQRRAEVVVEGAANHAGTTPMDRRRDALAAAARVVLAVEDLGRSGLVEVATVGRLEARPGVGNVVAGSATLTVDLRAVDDARLEAGMSALADRLSGIAGATGTEIHMFPTSSTPAVATDARIRTAIEGAAGALGLSWRSLPSGAGHDAQQLAALGPMAMIFVPSVGGLSHHPAEATDAADLVSGARVLLASLLALDEALDA